MGPAALRRSCYSWEGRRRLARGSWFSESAQEHPGRVPQRGVPTVTPEEICDGGGRAVCGSSFSESSDLKQTCILRDGFEEQCEGDLVAGMWNKSSLPRVRLGNRDRWWNGHHPPRKTKL